jgi:plasmid maintenance system killer protein
MENIILVELNEVNHFLKKDDYKTPISDRRAFTSPTVGKIDDLKNQNLYGIIIGGQYRTCVAIEDENDVVGILFDTWAIPQGKYVTKSVIDWKQRSQDIELALIALKGQPNYVPNRPCIEFYKSRDELILMVPVSD